MIKHARRHKELGERQTMVFKQESDIDIVDTQVERLNENLIDAPPSMPISLHHRV